jgi:catechol 2,3-dioxygenase-like lactoylglutathione lyase family enzyme
VTVTYTFAGLAVRDFAAAYDWYVRLFGRPADMFPHDEEAVWRLSSGGAIYVVADSERAGHGLVTLALDDLDAHAKRLHASGLAFTEQATEGSPRRLVVRDVDGNTITFFEDPAQQPA